MVLAALIWFCAATALAHDPGLSTATVRVRTDGLDVEIILSTRDAAVLTEPDGMAPASSSAQPSSSLDRLRSLATNALQITLDDRPIALEVVQCHTDETNANAIVSLRGRGPAFSKVSLRAPWLASLPPGHRQFLTVLEVNGSPLTQQLLSAQANTVVFSVEPINPDEASDRAPIARQSFGEFLVLGVKHILTGYDHVLFLFSLLMVSRRLMPTVRIITCFTIAHSMTLAIATLGWVEIPSRIVEPLIAASIIYVGIENLIRGDAPKGRAALTFAFGLVHGLGFASVLRELGVASSPAGLAVPLLSFNLGVELGQLLVALVALPMIWQLARRPLWAKRSLVGCSALVILAGGYWLIQRL